MHIFLQRGITWLLFIPLLSGALAECSEPAAIPTQPSDTFVPTIVSGKAFIDQQTAIDLATALASAGDGHVSGALETPQHIQATLASLDATQARLASEGWIVHLPDTADSMVWSVTMDGTWKLVGGPPPPPLTPTVARHLFSRFLVIIDAQTGKPLLTRPRQ